MKSELRKQYLTIRNSITDRENKNDTIFNKVLNDSVYINSKTVGLYYSLKSEVDTLKLIRYSLTHNKTIVLPRVEEDIMNFYEIKDLDELIRSKFGVLEPQGGIAFPKDKIDLIIVPGVVFDKNLNRIGFGKGYYDKYLSDYNGHTLGICYEEQMTDMIETDKYDIKLQRIITDKCNYE